MPKTTLAVREDQLPYLTTFDFFEKEAGDGLPWLRDIRRDAIERFSHLGFPTAHNEDWKYTNLAPLTKIPFEPARQAILSRESRAALPLLDMEAARLVFVNGYFAPELSSAQPMPQGVTVSSLREALESRPNYIQRHVARYAGYEDNALVALNTAFISEGLFVEIPDGVVVDRPIYALFVSTGYSQPAVAHPRVLVVAGVESQASIIEAYAGLNGGTYFTNAVTELVVGEGAVIEHYKLQRESAAAFHFGALQVEQGRSSNFTSHSIALGGALVRNEIGAVLHGEGAECALNGLYVVNGAQHVDNYTTMDHATPRCASHELYKGILDGAAQGVFHGRIIVRKDAQKTDAIQRNKNLLLSEKAVINTKPQLEIYADDVRCTHGATVGQVDQDAVFYLRSRGIGREDARNLLTYAFASDMVERVKVEAVRSHLSRLLFSHLSERPGAGEAL